jgi:3-hydroxyacyl-CoA dehydrogenase/enoyl-CoA hydratase/3-hydroxybutyryl-CoA epimerase
MEKKMALALKHWKLTTDAEQLAWLRFDRAGTGTNTFSSEALRELRQACQQLTASPPRGLAILSAKDNGFAAGADIDEFTTLASAEAALAFTALGNEVFDEVAALPFPTVAVIHGFCMGGGTELALACRYRVADDEPGTRLALPEVLIGIVPGWGGARRLPQLVGAPAALDLMLTGRGLDGRRARKLGLVDTVVARGEIEDSARQMLLKSPPQHRPSLVAAAAGWPGIRSFVAAASAKQVARKVRRDHYPAPYAIIDLWKDFGGDPRRVPAAHPASMASLFNHPTTRNLIRLFKLQDRMKALGKGDVPPIRHLHVIGAGAMGGDIAAWAALRGINVTLQDLREELITPALTRAAALFEKRLKQPDKVRAALDRLVADVPGEGVARADLVIEAIVENPDIKRKLFTSLEPRLKETAILATNTSSIPLQELSPALRRPERLVGLHFFNPVAQMMLVEIVQGPATSPAVMQAGQAFARQIDKLPLPCRSAPGFLVNRVLSPYLNEAMLMLDEGIPAVTIDAAARDFGMPMGPIELADMVGLDICWAVGQELAEPGALVPQRLRACLDAGHLGMKTGQGFYKWTGGKPQKESATGTADLAALADRMVLPALNEAVACVREQIVADADLCDAGVVFGSGFAPHRGGPIATIRARGKGELLGIMAGLRQKHGDRFAADPGWEAI